MAVTMVTVNADTICVAVVVERCVAACAVAKWQMTFLRIFRVVVAVGICWVHIGTWNYGLFVSSGVIFFSEN